MTFCLSIEDLKKWEEMVSPYVGRFKCYFENHGSLWNILLSEIPTGTEEPSEGADIEEPTTYRVLNKGSIMDRVGRPLPLFQVDETNNNKENEAMFKPFESDHDVELVAENILVAFEYSEQMKTKRWIKAITDETVCNPECIKLVPMFGKEEIGGEISHVAVHRFIREGLIDTFVKDEITEEERKAALESNRFQARKKSIPMNSKTGPPTREEIVKDGP